MNEKSAITTVKSALGLMRPNAPNVILVTISSQNQTSMSASQFALLSTGRTLMVLILYASNVSKGV
jgi:hypothetical protein